MTMQRGGQPQQRPGGWQGGGGRPSGEVAPVENDNFWRTYLKDGYFDEHNHLRPQLIVDDAIQVARRLARDFSGGGPQGMSPGQMRRFFDTAKYHRQRMREGLPFEEVVADIAALHRQAADAVTKDKAPRELLLFMQANLPLATKDVKGFSRGFLMHFESVVSYFSYLKKKGELP
ncbi:MAG: type III-A CRISPR-associated protein Csm2 [Chloroflexi bacterium]|nr:type III-A CRISPR-associated protein Csm2 [Chloroflexota bacterium]